MINFRNIFGGGDYKLPEVPDTTVQAHIDAEAKRKEEAKKREDGLPCYQVGKTADGRTTLFLGRDGYGSTLTMNNTGVDTLIRMLEAAKEPEPANENVVETEGEDDGSE